MAPPVLCVASSSIRDQVNVSVRIAVLNLTSKHKGPRRRGRSAAVGAFTQSIERGYRHQTVASHSDNPDLSDKNTELRASKPARKKWMKTGIAARVNQHGGRGQHGGQEQDPTRDTTLAT